MSWGALRTVLKGLCLLFTTCTFVHVLPLRIINKILMHLKLTQTINTEKKKETFGECCIYLFFILPYFFLWSSTRSNALDIPIRLRIFCSPPGHMPIYRTHTEHLLWIIMFFFLFSLRTSHVCLHFHQMIFHERSWASLIFMSHSSASTTGPPPPSFTIFIHRNRCNLCKASWHWVESEFRQIWKSVSLTRRKCYDGYGV